MIDLTRRLGAGLALAIAAAGLTPAAAQSPPSALPSAPPLDPAPCRELLTHMALFDRNAAPRTGISRPDDQTCRFAPVRIVLDRYIAYSIENLTVQGLLPGTTTDTDVHIAARGVTTAPTIPNGVAAYIQRVGAIPFEVDLDYTTDPAAQRVTLRRFAMSGETLGHLELHAELTGLTLPANPFAAQEPPDLGAVALRSLDLRLDNHGFVEHMVTPAIAAGLAGGSSERDPEPTINARRQSLSVTLRSLPPEFGLPQETKDALARFVADFPHPRLSLHCTASAEPPARLPLQAPAATPEAVQALLTALHPACTYAPAPG